MQFSHQHGHGHEQHIPSGHQWVKFTGSLPHNTVYAGDGYAVIKAETGGDVVVGKFNVSQNAAYVPYGGKEVHVTSNIEVLTHAPGARVRWEAASHGSLPNGAVGPVGKDGLFVGRAVCPQPENKATPGKIHPGHKCLYMPWGGKEERFDNYEVCVISNEPAHRWEKLHGSLPHGTIFASDGYAVIKAQYSGDTIVGKYNVAQKAAYVPYGGKEVHVTDNVEVLVGAPGAHVQWVQVSHGNIPDGAVGPIGNEKLFVGRAVCPQPENAYTPGKIHPDHKCLYLPWGGKEQRCDNYEACVIRF